MMADCTPDVKVLWAELRSLRTHIESVRIGDMRALELQAREYERRLDELNHAHKIAATKDGTFVSRELHDREFARVDRDVNTLARFIWIGVGIALIGEVFLWLVLSHIINAP